ncbi:tripartite tricarboxylate transporter permease [Alcaligenaceae bacterium]|nr:tripartite tricarboxylate transporter permease [Alcaligenaceae bacterium]
MLDNIILGFATAFSLAGLSYAAIGVVLGNIVGVLPGLSALATIALLLPLTYGLDPTYALIMLAGIYYGTSFGGAISAILLNLPGTSIHAVVCLDGHPMAKQGRGGAALFMSMFSSFFGVLVGVILMAFFSPIITEVATSFGAVEYCALMLLGLVAAAALSTESVVKSIASVLFGLLLGVVGMDANTGVLRLDFGISQLQDGFSIVALAMGLFGIADIFANAGEIPDNSFQKVKTSSVRPTRQELREGTGATVRGSLVGSFFGALPGTGSTIASFISYAIEKKVSKTPEKFGKGALQGVAGPEAANSSATITAFIPTLTLGIPGDGLMALMLGAMMLHNVQPGPLLMIQHPALFWGLVISFLIGNAFLLIINIPLIGIWIKLLSIHYRILYPIVLFLICIGVFSANNDIFAVYVVLGIGFFGYVLSSLGFSPAPLLLGFVLGPMIEQSFRRALIMSRGDLSVFLTSPVSAVCLAAILLLLVSFGVSALRRKAATS